MSIVDEAYFIATCIEGFFYGKLCALTCIFLEVQLFSGLGLYSGIFAMYLQCPSKKSRTAIILFYTVCLLYVLSTATFVGDFLNFILEVSYNSICKNAFLYISGTDASRDTIDSTSNWLTANVISHLDCPIHSKRLLWLPRTMYSSAHNHCTYHPICSPNWNLQRSTVVGSCGVKISVSWSFLYSCQSYS